MSLDNYGQPSNHTFTSVVEVQLALLRACDRQNVALERIAAALEKLLDVAARAPENP